jgi:hypothetical protein
MFAVCALLLFCSCWAWWGVAASGCCCCGRPWRCTAQEVRVTALQWFVAALLRVGRQSAFAAANVTTSKVLVRSVYDVLGAEMTR